MKKLIEMFGKFMLEILGKIRRNVMGIEDVRMDKKLIMER